MHNGQPTFGEKERKKTRQAKHLSLAKRD